MSAERLQKLIARRGLASRRQAEAWIRQGRVRVNGRVVTEMGVRVDPDVDRVEVDGRPLPPEAPRVVLVLRKPPGYVTTVRDPHAPRTVMEFVRDAPVRVFPVGRLDRDTRGVLLFTNDGELAHALLHPSRGVEKVYRVVAKGLPSPEALRRLEQGVALEDGPTAPARVWGAHRSGKVIRFMLALREGRKREVRRMVEAVGGRVIDLERMAFGPITARGLKEGQWRLLSAPEVEALRRAAGLEAS